MNYFIITIFLLKLQSFFKAFISTSPTPYQPEWNMLTIIEQKYKVGLVTTDSDFTMNLTLRDHNFHFPAQKFFPNLMINKNSFIFIKFTPKTTSFTMLTIRDPDDLIRLRIRAYEKRGEFNQFQINIFYNPYSVDTMGYESETEITTPFMYSQWILGILVENQKITLYTNCDDTLKPRGYHQSLNTAQINTKVFASGATLFLLNNGDFSENKDQFQGTISEFILTSKKYMKELMCNKDEMTDGSGIESSVWKTKIIGNYVITEESSTESTVTTTSSKPSSTSIPTNTNTMTSKTTITPTTTNTESTTTTTPSTASTTKLTTATTIPTISSTKPITTTTIPTITTTIPTTITTIPSTARIKIQTKTTKLSTTTLPTSISTITISSIDSTVLTTTTEESIKTITTKIPITTTTIPITTSTILTTTTKEPISTKTTKISTYTTAVPTTTSTILTTTTKEPIKTITTKIPTSTFTIPITNSTILTTTTKIPTTKTTVTIPTTTTIPTTNSTMRSTTTKKVTSITTIKPTTTATVPITTTSIPVITTTIPTTTSTILTTTTEKPKSVTTTTTTTEIPITTTNIQTITAASSVTSTPIPKTIKTIPTTTSSLLNSTTTKRTTTSAKNTTTSIKIPVTSTTSTIPQSTIHIQTITTTIPTTIKIPISTATTTIQTSTITKPTTTLTNIPRTTTSITETSSKLTSTTAKSKTSSVVASTTTFQTTITLNSINATTKPTNPIRKSIETTSTPMQKINSTKPITMTKKFKFEDTQTDRILPNGSICQKGEMGIKGDKGSPGSPGANSTCSSNLCTNKFISKKGERGEKGHCSVENCKIPETLLKIRSGSKGVKGDHGSNGIKGEKGDSIAASDILNFLLPEVKATLQDYINKNIMNLKGEPGSCSCETDSIKEDKKLKIPALVLKNGKELQSSSLNMHVGQISFLVEENVLLLKVDDIKNRWRIVKLDDVQHDWILGSENTDSQTILPIIPTSYQFNTAFKLMLIALPKPTGGDLRSDLYEPGSYSGSSYLCQKQAYNYGLGRAFYPLLNTDTFDFSYMIPEKYRYSIPIVNRRNEKLAANFADLIKSSTEIQAHILDFRGDSIMPEENFPCVWIGQKPSLHEEQKLNNDGLCLNWMSKSANNTAVVTELKFDRPFLDPAQMNQRSCNQLCYILCMQIHPLMSEVRKHRIY